MNKDKYELEVDKNYEWFIEHKKEIIEKNSEKIGYFALIKNQELVGLYKNYEEVFIAANTKFKNEPFSIQELLREEIIHNLGFVGLKLKWAR